ncbi:MAG: Sensor protein [uncultured bacterium]|uniref:histidine kinase n=1 Tax=Candidatus Daviesbacteria bacterium GW2011_GWC2_40_12 TaxID=1618431 RepID=A0A0G0TUS3_9BACT|nr:MAG: Sensor protein [uncultured bacterium]KKR16069.1 MAG: Multi-sensor signal transduction histidine kinase [Candidatus Daviesbacteria bacterium GW2011_GWA2_39_33]KKR25473.1 MAG: Multi-sensor signal transduction histidine kinase [Candidatus Daviesbacteria bacterium GW2011_GWB1_39_5]KKR41637.1 MAG: Multi-sensor signal transduction histidine kinase [Candidatus Daviesbacteria bacterium GW2011_GWC2_40_12]OGE22186.1 MAG: hypothetical protein A2778_03510 [Candidatus Daviesbacteria bacterium RIFCSP
MLFLAVTLFVVLCNISLGLITLFKNPKSASGILFFILSIILALWAITNYFSLQDLPPETILFWIRAVMFVTGAMFAVLYLLTDTFPKNSLSIGRIRLVLVIGFILLTQILSTTDLVFQRVEVNNGAVNPIPGPAIPIVAVNFVGFLLLTLITLYKKNRSSIGLERIRLKYLIFGITLTFILAITTNFIFVVFLKLTSFVALGPLFALILVGFIAYAIVKHRFLDIRLVVARSVSYFLLMLIAGVFYASGLFVVGTFITKQPNTSTNLITSTILALIIALSFQTFLRFFEKLTDSIFYKDHYSPQLLLSALGRIMASTLNLNELSTKLLKELVTQIKISGGYIVIKHNLSPIKIIAVGVEKQVQFKEEEIQLLIRQAGEENIIIFEELSESGIKTIMRENNLSIILPLVMEGESMGAILLGGKSSGEIYSEEDINLLKILGPEAAVAIRNGLSYEEIKRFNIRLSEEIKSATVDLQEANSRLKTIDKLKDDFVSIASHELRTPMTAIRSYAWMALHRSDVLLSQNLEKYVTRILISTERLINLVNDMLNVSRIESGKIEIKPEPVDLILLIKDIIDEVYFSKSEEKKISFMVLEKQTPKVFADPEKLRQVFLNLVGNSLKFTPNGGRIIFDFFTDGRVVETSVTDSGVGISKEDLSKLFNKFSRLDSSYTAAATSGGTGLGLYISKNLVQLMHGKIWASSEGLGKGTTFTVSLPVASAEVLKDIEKYSVAPKGEVKGLEPVAI